MRRIGTRLGATYAVVMLVFMGVLGLFLTHWLSGYYESSIESLLLQHGRLAAGFFERYLGSDQELGSVAQALAVQLADEGNGRVQVIGQGGVVLGDSAGAPVGRPRLVTPTVLAALRGRPHAVILPGGKGLVEAAVPIRVGGSVIGAVRLTSSLSAVDQTLAEIWQLMGIGALVAAAVTSLVALGLARTVTGPLGAIARAARELGRGRWEARVPVTTRDEVGEVADTINRMATELMRLERARAEFLGGISHELRTPLTAIKGYAVTLLDPQGGLPATERGYIGIIDREADRLGRLVDDLLELGRAQAGRLSIRPGWVDARALLEEVHHAMEPRAEQASVVLAPVEGAARRVWADEDRLRQVLLNLVDNAVKWSPAGGSVEMGVAEDAGRIGIFVRDHGPGISADDLPWVFERFYRGQGAARPGEGLGLAVSREIMRAQGGDLLADSPEDGGALMTAVLPDTAPPS